MAYQAAPCGDGGTVWRKQVLHFQCTLPNGRARGAQKSREANRRNSCVGGFAFRVKLENRPRDFSLFLFENSIARERPATAALQWGGVALLVAGVFPVSG